MMPSNHFVDLRILPLFAALLAGPALAASSHDHGASPAASATTPAAALSSTLRVDDCWIRVLPGKLPAAGYFQIVNDGEAPVILTGIRSSSHERAMLHATRTEQGMASMVHIDQLEVPAHGHLAFAPGGYHAMLEKPTRTLAPGDVLRVDFIFQGLAPLSADCTARPPGTLQ